MQKIITTSWDDGHPLDFRIANLLHKYNLQGTFYIPQRNGSQAMISERQMRELATEFEIGGHTLNHVSLNTPDANLLKNEIGGSFNWLSEVLGKAPVSFCFPKGIYNNTSLAAVFKYGYQLARTTELLSIAAPSVDRLLPTSLQVYSHSNITYTKHLAKRFKLNKLAVKLMLHPTTNLVKLTEHYMDKIEREGGCFHLWGHSWEIEENGLWGKLEELFRILSASKRFVFVQNGQLLPVKNDC